MKEIFAILIAMGAFYHVEDPARGGVTMINFTGTCNTEHFQGKVLDGGVDTQRHFSPENTLLSARYMMEGVDGAGKPCKVFVQNEGNNPTQGRITRPIYITDSEYLQQFQNDSIFGKMDFTEEGLYIRVYAMPKE